MLLGGLVGAANDFGEKFAVDIRQQEAERIGAPRAQASAGGIGRVTQLLGRLQHPLPGFRVNRAGAVEHAGDGGRGNGGFYCHFFDGRAHKSEVDSASRQNQAKV